MGKMTWTSDKECNLFATDVRNATEDAINTIARIVGKYSFKKEVEVTNLHEMLIMTTISEELTLDITTKFKKFNNSPAYVRTYLSTIHAFVKQYLHQDVGVFLAIENYTRHLDQETEGK